MSGFLLDTNIVSELRRARPHGGVLSWIASRTPQHVAISALTVGELEQGIVFLRRRDPDRADDLAAWLERLVGSMTVHPFDAECGRVWGRLARGREVHLVVDSMIAATALARGLTVATRNTVDFEPFGVAVLNPFGYRH